MSSFVLNFDVRAERKIPPRIYTSSDLKNRFAVFLRSEIYRLNSLYEHTYVSRY
jgi:hypothetical protein